MSRPVPRSRITAQLIRADFGKRWTHLSRANAAGWPGSRTYRRACRPPNGLSRILQGSLESLYGATFNPPTRCFAPLISHGVSPQGVMRSISKSFRRLHLRSEAVQAFTALRKVHYHHSTTLPAQEEDLRALTGERKPLSDFTVADEKGLLMGRRR